MYGFNNTTGNTGNSSTSLGLNRGAKLEVFEFNALAGAGGTAGEALDFTIKIGERTFKKRIFPITKVYRPKNGGEITDTNSEEYKEAVAKGSELLSSYLCAIALCFVSEEDLEAVLNTNIPDFKSFIGLIERAVKSNPNWSELDLDVFLRYQWAIKGDNNTTFLELPSNTKQGSFICKQVPGDFKENKTSSSLTYINEEGTEHPFKRGSWFLESKFANRQTTNTDGGAIEGETSNDASTDDW